VWRHRFTYGSIIELRSRAREGVTVQVYFKYRERNQLHVQYAATHGRGSLEYHKLGEAKGSLSAPDTSRRPDEHTKPTGKDAAGARVSGKERDHQEDILQESVKKPWK